MRPCLTLGGLEKILWFPSLTLKNLGRSAIFFCLKVAGIGLRIYTTQNLYGSYGVGKMAFRLADRAIMESMEIFRVGRVRDGNQRIFSNPPYL